MSTISELVVKIGADASGLNKGLQESKQQLDKTFSDVSPMKATEGAINDVSGSVTGLVGKFNGLVALAAGGFGLNSIIQSAVDAGAGIQNLADIMGVSAAEASTFSKTIKIAGGDTDLAQKALMKLDKSFQDGSKSGELCRNTLSAVGVSLADSSGKLLPVNTQLTKLAEGYKVAQAAGEGQQFVLNTLGSRGLALVPVLNNLAKAQQEVAAIRGTGLDPKEMQDLQIKLRTLEIQSGQLKVAFGGIFAELLGGDVQNITAWLGDLAKEFKDNREEIKRYTSTVLGLVAAYTAVKTAAKVGTTLADAYKRVMPVADTVEDAKITAQQERSIAAREKKIMSAAQKEETAYYKTLQAMKITEAEKTELFIAYCIERETAATEEAALYRQKMTEAYLGAAARAKESTAQQVVSIREVGVAAEETAAQARNANAVTAESAGAVRVANAEVSESYVMRRAASAETAAIEKTGNAETALSAAAVANANKEVAITSEAAGATSVVAGAKSSEAAIGTTKQVYAQAAAHGEVGKKAAGATGTIISGSGKAIGVVKGLTSMVWGLAGGWLGVAAAIAYASYCAYQFAQQKKVEEQEHTFEVDGKKYVERDGHFYRQGFLGDESQGAIIADTETAGAGAMAEKMANGGKAGMEEVTDSDTLDALQDAWFEKHKNDKDYLAKLEAEEAAEKAANITIPTLDGIDTSGGKTSAAHEEKPVEVQMPVSQVAYNIASSHIGENWGENTCAKFFSAAFDEAGFDVPSDNPDWVPDIQSEAERRGAYHKAGDGFIPKKGDAVIWGDNDHIGISNGDGTHIASNSHGVTSAPDSGYYHYGDPTGYIDMSALSGGKTVAVAMDKAGQTMQKAADALAKAQDKANTLMSSMRYGTVEDSITNYQKAKHSIKIDVDRKNKEINELEAAGVDVSALRKQLAAYETALNEKMLKPWKEANDKIRRDTAAATAEAIGDYSRLAEITKETAIAALDKEREERQKAVAKNSNDKAAALEVERWYYAERRKIDDEYTRSLQQAQNKRLQFLANKGAYKDVLAVLKQQGGSTRQSYLDLEGEKAAASEVIKIWDAAHASIAGSIAGATENLYGSLTSSIQAFCSGTKSAIGVVHDLGSAILSEIARIVAQKAAANIIGSIFGMFGGGGRSGVNSSVFSKYLPSTSFNTGSSYTFKNMIDSTYVHPFAAGGIVTAPTLGLIGEAGQNEAIIPLNQLENFLGKKQSGSGGVQVNIVNNSDSKPRVANTHYDSELKKTVLDIVIDGASRNVGGFGTNLKTALR